MKDNVPKGTGNSRYLKSAISASATWEQFRDMLRNGTLPIDLGGINAAGWQVVGDALNKANLLPDSVASALGLTMSNPQVKDALSKISGKAQVSIGAYTGTGTSGSGNKNSLSFSFVPKLVIVEQNEARTDNYVIAPFIYGMSTLMPAGYSDNFELYLTWSGTRLSWYSTREPISQLNHIGRTYYYVAIG